MRKSVRAQSKGPHTYPPALLSFKTPGMRGAGALEIHMWEIPTKSIKSSCIKSTSGKHTRSVQVLCQCVSVPSKNDDTAYCSHWRGGDG